MIRRLLVVLLVTLLSWLAWSAWIPDPPPEEPVAVEIYVQPPPSDAHARWRVLTHRMVWKQAVADLQRTLRHAGLRPSLLRRREAVELFVFDDARKFSSRKAAMDACAAWRAHGVECDVQRLDSRLFILAVGRFYIPEFARQHERKLQDSGLPYRVTQRTVRIPTMRFVFPPMPRQQAEALWRKLRSMGLGQPVMLEEEAYRELYGPEAP